MNVYQKLNAARSAFHSKPLKKSGHNNFAGYDYFELGDFVIPALSVFAEHGLTSVISFGDVASMTIVNNDKPEETIVITSPRLLRSFSYNLPSRGPISSNRPLRLDLHYVHVQ